MQALGVNSGLLVLLVDACLSTVKVLSFMFVATESWGVIHVASFVASFGFAQVL